MVNYNSAVEHAHHHEISISRREGKTNLQLAAFYDRVVDPALTGVGELSTDRRLVLPDIYSGTFTYQGNTLQTEGVRLVWPSAKSTTISPPPWTWIPAAR